MSSTCACTQRQSIASLCALVLMRHLSNGSFVTTTSLPEKKPRGLTLNRNLPIVEKESVSFVRVESTATRPRRRRNEGCRMRVIEIQSDCGLPERQNVRIFPIRNAYLASVQRRRIKNKKTNNFLSCNIFFYK